MTKSFLSSIKMPKSKFFNFTPFEHCAVVGFGDLAGVARSSMLCVAFYNTSSLQKGSSLDLKTIEHSGGLYAVLRVLSNFCGISNDPLLVLQSGILSVTPSIKFQFSTRCSRSAIQAQLSALLSYILTDELGFNGIQDKA